MNNYTRKVGEFHKAFECPILDKPQIPSIDRAKLRIDLLQEELDEFKQAIENNDLIEVLDSLVDLEYILHGSVLEFGLQNIFDSAFEEVQNSNMSKACSNEDEAKATVEHYKAKGTDGYYVERDGKWFVYRSEDNKVLKSIGYHAAELQPILDEV